MKKGDVWKNRVFTSPNPRTERGIFGKKGVKRRRTPYVYTFVHSIVKEYPSLHEDSIRIFSVTADIFFFKLEI
jgi:hypothetical protein